MVDESGMLLLKRILLKEVAYLCRPVQRQWNAPIVRTLRDIHSIGSRAVFFGGTLRSLLVSRLFYQKPGRPRDLDIVVAGTTVEELRGRFEGYVTRETRFGGIRMERMAWSFDVWPLDRTWAFVQDNVTKPDFAALPCTTFLNLEAITVDVWPSRGRSRSVYSGDDQFFHGVLSRTIEVNREQNPFPTLCVVRSLVMAAALDFSIGPRLAAYVARHGNHVSKSELESIQRKHYGTTRYSGKTLKSWIRQLVSGEGRDENGRVRLPIARQLAFWPRDERRFSVNTHVLPDDL